MKKNKLSILIKDKNIQKQLLKYLLVGISTASFELLLYTLFRRVIHLNLSLSNITATITATLLNFIINRGWSFKSTSNVYRSFTLYTILFCLNIIFSTTAINAMVHFGIIDITAKFITMITITAWNFILYRKVIFK